MRTLERGLLLKGINFRPCPSHVQGDDEFLLLNNGFTLGTKLKMGFSFQRIMLE